MKPNRIFRYAWIGAIGFVLACTCSTLSSGVATLSSIASALPSALPGNSTGAAETIPALTPNPLTVKLTLDKAHAVTSNAETGVARDSSLYSKLASGVEFTLQIPGGLIGQAADGSLIPAFGTAVTVTPVSAIDGIPFRKGYLAAFQIDPEGLLLAEPGLLIVDLSGNYNAADLVGFASDGTGTNFHLFPIQASSGGGTTNILIALSHFSMYGVAQATASEITAQQAQTPLSPGDQDDDLLAAPTSKIQQNLKTVHNRSIKPLIDKLDNLAGDCNEVTVAAYQFEKWFAQVQNAGQQKYFQDTINHDTTVLAERLKDCLKKTCPPCLAGKKSDKKNANTFIVQATFMQSIDKAIDKMDDYNTWAQLINQCAENAGLPLPAPPVAACEGTNCGPTATPATCP
jgi:hypothetical protein